MWVIIDPQSLTRKQAGKRIATPRPEIWLRGVALRGG